MIYAPRLKTFCIQKKWNNFRHSLPVFFGCVQKFRVKLFWEFRNPFGWFLMRRGWWFGASGCATLLRTGCPVLWLFDWLSWVKFWTFLTIFAEVFFNFRGWNPSQFGPHFVLITSYCGLRCPPDVRRSNVMDLIRCLLWINTVFSLFRKERKEGLMIRNNASFSDSIVIVTLWTQDQPLKTPAPSRRPRHKGFLFCPTLLGLWRRGTIEGQNMMKGTQQAGYDLNWCLV